ncbi:MAG: DUF3857 domain-containing protein [Myxococcota bacterium]
MRTTSRCSPSLCALLPLLLSCGTQRPVLERMHATAAVEARDFPGVPAVVLLDRTELTFTYSPQERRPYAASLHTWRVQLLDERALSLARLRIPFDERSAVLHVRSRVMKPDGKVLDGPVNRYVEEPRFPAQSAAGHLYKDSGYLVTKAFGAEVGDVVEFSYLRVYRDPRWLEPVRIGGPLPVVRGEVVVDAPIAYDIDYRVTRLGAITSLRPVKLPHRIHGPDGEGEGVPGQRLVFVFDNQPAVYPEEQQPDAEVLATEVHTQLRGYTVSGQRYDGYRSWDDVANWYKELVRGRDAPDEHVAAAVKRAGGRFGSKKEKFRRVQRFLQDRIDDVPTFMNLAALPARRHEEVLEAGLGDAKDQASLGLAMLREMGLDAFPVLVSRRGSHNVVPDLPTPAPFNHVILAVPAGGSYQYLDPSTPALPLGRLPGALQGQRGLLLRGERAEFIDLPVDEPSDNLREARVELRLDEEGVAAGSMRLTLSGLDAAKARVILAAEEEPVERLRVVLGLDKNDGLAWESVTPVGARRDDPDRPLELEIIFAPGELAVRHGRDHQLSFERVLGRSLPTLWRESRRTPLVVPHPYEERLRFLVELAPSKGVADLPPASVTTTDLLELDARWSVASGVVAFDRDLRLHAHVVERDEYPLLHAAVQALWRAEGARIRVQDGGDRGMNYGDSPF